MFTVEKSVKILKTKIKKFPELCIVLGTGWNEVLSQLDIEQEIPYAEIFGVGSGVPGHQGKLVIAKQGKKRVAFMVGRFHIYEGYTSEEVTRPVQTFAQLGLKRLMLTAAAGGLNEKIQPGDFVVMSDIITMFCQTPLVGAQFIDMSQVFDLDLRKQAIKTLSEKNLPFREGIYAYAHGPHFETPADKMLLHHLGADMVGMSCVPEAIMARSLGVKLLGIGFVTNLAFVVHNHLDVLRVAQESSSRMAELLAGIIQWMA